MSKTRRRELPQGWRWAQLGDVCEVSRCSIDGKSIEARELPYLSLENIESHSGKITLDSDPNSYTQGTSNCFRFECEHVLYGKLRPYLNKVALPDFSGRCTTELIPISPGSDIEREFLALILRRPETVDWAMAEVTGSRMPRANMKRLMRLEIPLPSLSEQKRIVADLNKKMVAVEKARAATLERVEAIRVLPAAFLREVFSFDGGKLPRGWRWVQLGDVCKIVGGTTPSTLVPDYWGGDINWVTPSDLGKLESSEIQTSSRKITRKALEETKLLILPVGTVVLSSRAPIGHLGIARIPFCTNQGCKSFIPSPKIETDYLYYGLKFYVPDFERLGSGATFKEISKTKLNKFEIPLPPLSEQKRIVADLNKKMAAVEKARNVAEAESEATHALPAAFLREAFSGAL